MAMQAVTCEKLKLNKTFELDRVTLEESEPDEAVDGSEDQKDDISKISFKDEYIRKHDLGSRPSMKNIKRCFPYQKALTDAMDKDYQDAIAVGVDSDVVMSTWFWVINPKALN
ncbi:hypothetical protein BGX26_000145 [Mortierella sp. AD094]|nr:hypothetical protein BGX26_000145 [Mortierella sp. AD094]